MIPTLQIDDRLVVNKLVYHFNDQIVVILFYLNRHMEIQQFVKRLIGLPGDSVEIRRGIVYINDQPLVFSGVTVRRDYSF